MSEPQSSSTINNGAVAALAGSFRNGYSDDPDDSDIPMPAASYDFFRNDIIEIDSAVLRRFFAFFKGTSGTSNDFDRRMENFRVDLVTYIVSNGYQGDGIQTWVDTQLGLLRAIMQAMSDVTNSFNMGVLPAQVVAVAAAPPQDPAMAPDSLPISDDDIIDDFMAALQDGSSVFDMPDTAPLKHWHNDMKGDSLHEIAAQFLVGFRFLALSALILMNSQEGFKRIHGARDENHMYHGYSFKTRYDTVVEVLRVGFVR
jgi:hypothetical protein